VNSGLHAGISEDVYNRIPAVRSTILRKLFRTTPLHAHHVEQFGDEGSEAKDGGYLFHMAVLEPDRFDQVVQVLPDFGAMQSSINRAKRDAHIAAHPGVHWIKEADRAVLLRMRDAVYDHPLAQYLFVSDGVNEATLLWDDEASGLRMKARADRLVTNFQGSLCVAELKRARDASPWGFGRAAWDYRYDMQMAVYSRGLDAIFGEAERYSVFVVCEPSAPYAVACYELGREELAIGKRDLEVALATYAHAQKTGEWRGYPDALVPVRLPGWVYRTEAEELAL
jgi:hypothetical protein